MDSPFECMPARALSLSVHHIEHLDCPVGRASREALSVVIELGIVLLLGSCKWIEELGTMTHDHVLMGRFDRDSLWSGGGRLEFKFCYSARRETARHVLLTMAEIVEG